MTVRLKGNTPKPGETDKRYYMIDVQYGLRRERLSSGTRDKKLAERKEQIVLDAMRADPNVTKAELVTLIRGQQRADGIMRRADVVGETLNEAFELCKSDPDVWARNRDLKKTAQRIESIMSILGPDIRLAAIDDECVDRLKRALHAAGNAPATINRKFSALRVVLSNAIERGKLAKLPKIKKQSGERKRKYVLSAMDEEAIYAAMLERDTRETGPRGGYPVKRDAALYIRFFKVMGETGCRPAELLSVPWRNIDFQRGFIKIVHSAHAGTVTKSGKDRNVPITDRCRALLLERWGVVKHGPFADLNHRRANEHWLESRRACGIDDPDCVPYANRHTLATKLGEETGDLKLIQEWLGHSDIGITSSTYVHTTSGHMARGAEALNKRRAVDEAELASRDRESPVTGTSPATTSTKLN